MKNWWKTCFKLNQNQNTFHYTCLDFEIHCAVCVQRELRDGKSHLKWRIFLLLFLSSSPWKVCFEMITSWFSNEWTGCELWSNQGGSVAQRRDPRRRYFVRLKLLFPFTFLMSSYLQLGKLEFILTSLRKILNSTTVQKSVSQSSSTNSSLLKKCTFF